MKLGRVLSFGVMVILLDHAALADPNSPEKRRPIRELPDRSSSSPNLPDDSPMYDSYVIGSKRFTESIVLAEMGVLAVEQKRVRVLNPAALHQIAEHEDAPICQQPVLPSHLPAVAKRAGATSVPQVASLNPA